MSAEIILLNTTRSEGPFSHIAGTVYFNRAAMTPAQIAQITSLLIEAREVALDHVNVEIFHRSREMLRNLNEALIDQMLWRRASGGLPRRVQSAPTPGAA